MIGEIPSMNKLSRAQGRVSPQKVLSEFFDFSFSFFYHFIILSLINDESTIVVIHASMASRSDQQIKDGRWVGGCVCLLTFFFIKCGKAISSCRFRCLFSSSMAAMWWKENLFKQCDELPFQPWSQIFWLLQQEKETRFGWISWSDTGVLNGFSSILLNCRAKCGQTIEPHLEDRNSAVVVQRGAGMSVSELPWALSDVRWTPSFSVGPEPEQLLLLGMKAG